jgi:hypothetical protein
MYGLLTGWFSDRPENKLNVDVYHVNQVGDPDIVDDELADLTAMANLSRQTWKQTGRLPREIIVAIHGALSVSQSEKLRQLSLAHHAYMRVVAVTDDLKQAGASAYSYTKLLRKTQEEGVHLRAVDDLLAGRSDVGFQTFSKIPSQFIADGVLADIWELLVNLGRGWRVVPVDRRLDAARRAGINA